MNALIEFQDVCKYYHMGDTTVVAADHISFQIRKGEFVAIVGSSGSGKSTCMNIIGCLDVPTAGTYRLNGRDVGKMSRDELASIRNEMLGFIFQQYNLLPKLNLLENVEVPLVYAGISRADRHIRARLMKEIETNVALRVEETETSDAFLVSGRGELHLSVLIETMRREGFELEVSKPQVIYKTINGKRCEPLERLTVEVPQEFMGAVMEGLGPRRAEMISMEELAGYMKMDFSIPARGLLGFRNELLTTTRGTGIMYHVFQGYAPYKGDIPERTRGSLVAFEAGTTTAYGLNSILDRGELFLGPGVEVYEGMIVGENAREQDMDVNPCKKKHLTNTRASGSDDAIKLPPCRLFTLESALEWINDDELVEVTPSSIRMRKMVLSKQLRYKNANAKKSQSGQ